MSNRDYYEGATSDIIANGIPAVCTTQDSYHQDKWGAANPGDIAILATLEGADISGTFLTTWTKFPNKKAMKATIQDVAKGFFDPNPPAYDFVEF